MKKRILTLALTVILVLNFAGVANAAENQAKFNFTGTGFQLILNILPNYYIESGTSVEWKESSEKTESEYWNEGGSIQTATNDSLMDINLFLDSEKNVTTIQTGFVLDENGLANSEGIQEKLVETAKLLILTIETKKNSSQDDTAKVVQSMVDEYTNMQTDLYNSATNPTENGNEGERLIDETDYQIIEKYKWSTEGETKLFVDIVFVPKTV